MPRVLSYILAFTALIVQIGIGALPVGDACMCIPVAPTTPECCCDDPSDCAAPAERLCPCHNGCKNCICVPKPDNRATLTARPLLKRGDSVVVVAMLLSSPAPAAAPALPGTRAAPRATESPPHLEPMRTTRLIL